MVKRQGKSRRKTRYLLKKKPYDKGKISLKSYFKQLKEGDKVKLIAEPAVHEGPVFRRFYGRSGIVQSKKGRCYEVKVNDGKKQKLLIVHPVHLEKM